MKLGSKRFLVFSFLLFGCFTLSSCSGDQQGELDEIESQEDEQGDQDQEEDQENQYQQEYEEGNESLNQSDENSEYQNSANNMTDEGTSQFEGNQAGMEGNQMGMEGNQAGMEGNQMGMEGNQQGDLQEIIEEMNQGGDQLAVQDSGQMLAQEENVVQEIPAEQASDGMASMGVDGGSPAPVVQAASNPQGLPELGSKMSYIVQRGDTLGRISTKIYGTPGKWREIADFTGISNPNTIYPGDLVYYQLTDQSLNFASQYENLPRSEVQVQAGETLSVIAARVMGSSADWKHLWRLNDNINNPDQLTAGTTIYYVAPSDLGAFQADSADESLASSIEKSTEQWGFVITIETNEIHV